MAQDIRVFKSKRDIETAVIQLILEEDFSNQETLNEIADQIFQEIGSEVRVTVPGHTQRGGEPCPYDRVLSTRIGAGAAQAIVDGAYGVMIGVVNGKIKRIPLEECAGKLKMVSPKDQLVLAAKQIGISFGD